MTGSVNYNPKPKPTPSKYTPSRRKNYTGQKFNYLTAVSYAGLIGSRRNSTWIFQCDCGNKIQVPASRVVRGETKSGGCLKRKMLSERQLLPDGMSIKKSAYATHMKAAQKRGYVSYLSFEDYLQIALQPCYYCGGFSDRKSTDKKRTAKVNSVDRLDNEPYYKKENSVPACFDCQKMKTFYRESDFLGKVEQIYNYRKLGKT